MDIRCQMSAFLGYSYDIITVPMKKYFLVGFIALSLYVAFCFGQVAFAADTSNTGFIPGTIWYSKDPLIEGETVKVYTAVWNGDTNPLSAKVEFYDKNVILGSRTVSVAAQTIAEVSISWQVTAGDHVISAKIVSSNIIASGKPQTVVLERNNTGEDRVFVDKIIKDINGAPVSSTDLLTDQASAKLANALPDSISAPVSNALGAVDEFRDETYTKITSAKEEVKKTLDAIPETTKSSTDAKKSTSQTKSQSLATSTQKPLAYIKLFFWTIAGYIFGYKPVFYIVCAGLLFLILRFIYRKIRTVI